MASATSTFMDAAKEFTFKLWAAKETALLQQIKDLVDRDILVVEEQQPVLVCDKDSGDYSIKQMVRLTVKDMEYIKRLEDKIVQLKRALDCLTDKPTRDTDATGRTYYEELLK